MKIITEHLSKKDAKLVTDKVNKLLTKTMQEYFAQVKNVHKTSAKVKSKMGYPDKMLVQKNAVMSFTGVVQDNEVLVWPVFIGPTTWFKTSPVKKIKVTVNKLYIETENSHYVVEI